MLADASGFLGGKVLIAMPGIGDPRFERSVIYMCTHSEEVAMGLILNKPASDILFENLLEQLDIAVAPGLVMPRIVIGGPVERSRGFVLHSDDYRCVDGTLPTGNGIGMTASVDILRDIACGRGPSEAILALGYSGWGPGQLEREIRANGWLVCDADAQMVFANDAPQMWQAALARLGVDAHTLSRDGGMA
ncbi:MAG: YqgE/AlgH family protein [Pseudomonadota bacterium]